MSSVICTGDDDYNNSNEIPHQIFMFRFSGALLVEGSMSINTPAFHAGIQFNSEAASLIDFTTNVDFYDKLKMCLQMSRPGLTYK